MVRPAEFLPALLVAAALLLTSAPAESKTTYRWRDADGEWQYGEAPPAGLPYSVSTDGAIWKAMQPATNDEPEIEDKGPQPLLTPEEQRQQRDILLRAKYRGVEDIEKARQVELDYVRLDEHTEREQLRSLRRSLFERLRNAADRQRAGLPVDAAQRRQIEGIRTRMLAGERSLQELEQRRDGIEQRYDEESTRYRELVGVPEPGP